MNTLPLRFLAFLSIILTIFINLLANALPIAGRTTAEISDMFGVLFVPAGYVFAIWGLIYIAILGYGIWQIHHKQEKLELADRIAPLVIITSIANSIWIFLWHNLQIELSLFAMLTLLLALIMIYTRVAKYSGDAAKSSLYKVFVKGTFSLYLGWISVATIANVTNVLYLRMYDIAGTSLELLQTISFRPMLLNIPDEIWAASLIVIAGVLASAMLIRYRDFVYALVILWALVGIYVKFTEIREITIAVFASVLIILAAMNLVRMRKEPLKTRKKRS
ncbi:MAG: hypothetical protein TR69_WS6001000944 [candidate division WS6 bacterium OLB20]|uniref:Tryptophan-rich sensory protein n=1 Tax=candidate division WS6 bacterium OLB20 TaxID=1617426 RepID=A0A136LZ44_9BACT|nr:MAG: hypothetical protein TR69_WS6001000944 [candidate division WS6 bacterium OLB20]